MKLKGKEKEGRGRGVSGVLLARHAPEADLLQVEGVLDDAGGRHPHAQDVLLGRQVVGLCYSVKIGQVAGEERKRERRKTVVRGC